MKVTVLAEPELEFGVGRHIDIRFGIMDHGPLDYKSALAPHEIRVGIVGTPETVEGVMGWLERCRSEIAAKASRQPYLFPRFPGFSPDAGFHSTLILEPRLQRTIPAREFELLAKSSDEAWIVRAAVMAFFSEVEHLAEEGQVDVVVCAVPMSLLDVLEREPLSPEDEEAVDGEEGSGDDVDATEEQERLDFHHLLKARAMALRLPIQLILPMTYDPSKRRHQKRRAHRLRQLQDEATRAWNIHTAIYYKAGGTPWRLIRDSADLATCHVGISFYRTLDRSSLLTSMAQVFNERGDGVIVRGGKADASNEDRQAHLSEEASFTLLDAALVTYKAEHKNLPARVVLHKSSGYNEAELSGFVAAAAKRDIEAIDCTSIRRSYTRLFRRGQYPPLRGTRYHLDDEYHVLYTRGSVDFFATYPGMYVPRPLEIRCERTEQTPAFLAHEILALTKMNWNDTQFDGREPITLHAARQVADILKHVGEGDRIEPRYAFYM